MRRQRYKYPSGCWAWRRADNDTENTCLSENLGKRRITGCFIGTLKSKPKPQDDTILWVTELVVLHILSLIDVWEKALWNTPQILSKGKGLTELSLERVTIPDIWTEVYTLDRAPSAHAFHRFCLQSHPLINDHHWRGTFFHFYLPFLISTGFLKKWGLCNCTTGISTLFILFYFSLSLPSQLITLNLLCSFHHISCQSGPKILHRVSHKWQEDQHSHPRKALALP